MHILTLALLLVTFVAPGRAGAQTADDLFNPAVLHDVRVYIHSRDLDEMRARFTENIYFPADFEWRGIRVRNVGVRVRGLASRSPVKPGLEIHFGRYAEGQTFLGLQTLVLDNCLKDASLLREWTSMAFIRRAGHPASRESFARVFINGQYEGLYAAVEPVDALFLARQITDGGLGYLFEHKFLNGFYAEYLGDDYAAYKVRFEARTHRLESDFTLYSPIELLFREVNQPVDAVWRERVESLIDLRQLVTYVAVEAFLSEVDGFLGYAGMANFYLYRPVATNRHVLVAWDRDSTFQAPDMGIFGRMSENQLFSRAMMFEDLRTLYLDVLEQCARLASDNGWLEQQIAAGYQVIREAVYQDTTKPVSNDDFEAAVGHLLSFARTRPTFVLDAIAKAR